jgi:hypothetical protein
MYTASAPEGTIWIDNDTIRITLSVVNRGSLHENGRWTEDTIAVTVEMIIVQ